jgi:hypothetical protein
MFYIIVCKTKNSNTATLYHVVGNSIVKENCSVYFPDNGFLKAETKYCLKLQTYFINCCVVTVFNLEIYIINTTECIH